MFPCIFQYVGLAGRLSTAAVCAICKCVYVCVYVYIYICVCVCTLFETSRLATSERSLFSLSRCNSGLHCRLDLYLGYSPVALSSPWAARNVLHQLDDINFRLDRLTSSCSQHTISRLRSPGTHGGCTWGVRAYLSWGLSL